MNLPGLTRPNLAGLRERQSTVSEKMAQRPAAAYSDDSDGEDESSPVDSALARLTSSQQLDENDKEELDVIVSLLYYIGT